MNKRNASTPLLWLGTAGLVLSLLGGIYLGPTSASKIENRLKTKVETSLADAGYGDWARVEMTGQKAVLMGFAPSSDAEEGALNAAKTAAGPGGVLVGGVTKVIDKVFVAPFVSPYVWSAKKEGQTVVLSGHAPSEEALEEIASVASALFGDDIDNQMSLATGVPGNDGWLDLVRLSLGQLNALESGEASLTDTSLIISGSARNIETVADVQSALLSVAHPFTAGSQVVGPFHWAATVDDDVLILSGGVPTEAAREILLQAASQTFGGEIVDNMIQNNRTGWVKTAELALEHIGRFKSGKVQLVEDTFVFSGEASQSAFSYLNEDTKKFTRPFSAQLDINTIGPDLPELEGLNLEVSGEAKQEACQEAFVRIMTANRIYFQTNSASLDRKSGRTLDKLITVAKGCSDLAVDIEGHTDDRGDRTFNLELSQKRASSVQAYFVERGLSADTLNAVGFGPDRPADTNATPEGRQHNRRIEFKVAIKEDR